MRLAFCGKCATSETACGAADCGQLPICYWLLTVAGLTLCWDAALTPWCRSYLSGDAT